MSTKHTPGPWNYAGPSDIGRDTYSIYGNGPLAYTAGPSDYGETAEANARLIAAAPDLLEALKDVVSQIAAYDKLFGKNSCAIDDSPAKYAIDKATGQQGDRASQFMFLAAENLQDADLDAGCCPPDAYGNCTGDGQKETA